ncbi:MAPEG family protein [Salipiger sp. IMCC34102]|uniref:MAPEG family protein n=1 Tax=Salipiger sp. IMCC34102 TaxID=2510647 RepID=UPI00101BE193|nr:MAPEG family protein [Salipiger sp. IMCC34102]RYH04542.1 MAPEG family protein [Salipiger sp. IMCC34102]
MTPELTALTFAGLLQGLQFALVSIRANLELPGGKLLSPRDPQRMGKPIQEQVSVGTGRLFRALNNHFEGLILFTLAVVVLTLGDKATGLTAGCAWVYLAARILYVPAYYFGWMPWRSLIWFVGFLATMLMLLSALI